jgi:hypothetical protein
MTPTREERLEAARWNFHRRVAEGERLLTSLIEEARSAFEVEIRAIEAEKEEP